MKSQKSYAICLSMFISVLRKAEDYSRRRPNHPRNAIMRNRTSGCGITRRSFLADTGMGFTGLALSAMLHRDGIGRASEGNPPPNGQPHFPAKAKSVIWIFCCGGTSHLE